MNIFNKKKNQNELKSLGWYDDSVALLAGCYYNISKKIFYYFQNE